MTLEELEALVLELRGRVAALEFDAMPVPSRLTEELLSARRHHSRTQIIEVAAVNADQRSEDFKPGPLGPSTFVEKRRDRRSSSQRVIRQHVDIAQHLERIQEHVKAALESLAEGSRVAVVADREEQ